MEIIAQFDVLRKTRQRLLAIQECPNIAVAGSRAVMIVTTTKDIAQQLNDSLLELISTVQDLQGDVPNADIPASLTEIVSELLSPLVASAKALEGIVDQLQASAFPVVLASTYIPQCINEPPLIYSLQTSMMLFF